MIGRPDRLGVLFTALIAAVVLAVVVLDPLWSASVDFAHHYVLVSRIYENGRPPPPSDFSAGEMSFYPPGAHAVGAVLGRLLASPILGMHVSGFVWLLLLWLSLATIVAAAPDAEVVARIAVTLCGLALARGIGLDVHGCEVVRNYFLAQIAAQSLMLAVLAVWLRFTDRWRGPAMRYGLPAACAVAMVGFHALPALLLLATLAVLIATDQALTPDAARLRTGALILAAAALAAWFHPSFAAMRTIATFDGVLLLKYTPDLPRLAVLTCGALALAVFGIRRTLLQRRIDALGLMSAYGAAASLLCLAQCGAFLAGYGSRYACLKYGFALNTALVLLASWLGARTLVERLAGSSWHTRLLMVGTAARPFLVALVMAAAIFLVRPRATGTDISRLVEVDSALRTFHVMRPLLPGGRPDLALGISGLAPSLCYAESIATLGHPRDQNAVDVLHEQLPAAVGEERYLITSPRYYSARPTLQLDAGLVAVDASAVEGGGIRGISYPFSRDLPSVAFTGFSSPEAFGRWTDGGVARCVCPVPATLVGRVGSIRIRIARGYSSRGQAQRAEVSVNGSAPRVVEVGEQPTECVLPVEPGASQLDVRFRIPGAESPAGAGLEPDYRLLGLAVQGIDLIVDPSR